MALTDSDIGELLLEQSYISQEELDDAIKQCKVRKTSLLAVPTEQGLITQHLFESALCEHYKLEFVDLQSTPPDPDAISLLPEEVAEEFSVIVIKKDGRSVTVATSDPSNELLEEAIKLNLEQEEAYIPEAPAKEEKGKGKKGKGKRERGKKRKRRK